MRDLLPEGLRKSWDRFEEDLREFFWDESRVLMVLIAAGVMLVGLLYFTGVFSKARPYLYLGYARFQILFRGPGEPEETYTKLIGLRPSWGEIYLRRGRLRESRKLAEQSLADYEMASTLMGTAEAYVAHGRVAVSLDRYDQALWDFKTALEKDPLSAEAYNERGKMYFKQRLYAEALVDYKKALELQPASVDARIGVEKAEREMDQEKLKGLLMGE